MLAGRAHPNARFSIFKATSMTVSRTCNTTQTLMVHEHSLNRHATASSCVLLPPRTSIVLLLTNGTRSTV